MQKTGPQDLKLPFASSHLKDNAEAINFHIKNMSVQGLVFMEKKFERYTVIKQFSISEDGGDGIKTTIANL